MQEIRLGDQIIRYNRERTRTAYASVTTGSAEKCGCRFCRNFIAQRNRVYPEQFRQLLGQLGIPTDRESDVFELGPEGSLVLYNGWFYLAGELIEAGELMTDGSKIHLGASDCLVCARVDHASERCSVVRVRIMHSWVMPETSHTVLCRQT
jgi:hypothetical protein